MLAHTVKGKSLKNIISARPRIHLVTKLFKLWLGILLSISLSACSGRLNSGSVFGNPEEVSQKPTINSKSAARVALLVPLSGQGQIGEIGRSLKEAGELAIFDAGGSEIVLVPIDTKGTPDGARLGAKRALQEKVEFIIVPLL